MEKIMRRKVDPLGRIILPAEFRTRLGIEKDSEIEIVCEKDRMIIKKVSPYGGYYPAAPGSVKQSRRRCRSFASRAAALARD